MNRILFKIVVLLLKAISLLPFTGIYLLSDLLFFFLYHVFRYRRKVVQLNLSNAFPLKSADELAGIEKRFYRHLADIMLESVKSISISPEELKRRYGYRNLSEMKAQLAAGRKVIVVSGHYGNWEWGAFSLPLYIDQKSVMVYKPLSDLRFDKLVYELRSRFNALMIPMKQTLRTASEMQHIPHVLGLAGDQTPSLPESQYFTAFLNQPTAVFLGIEKIARRFDYIVGFMSVRKKKRGFYEVEYTTLVDSPRSTRDFEITDIHTRKLEELIMERPEYWLWSHRRWKFKPEDVKR